MSILAGFMVPHPPMIVPEIGRGSERQVLETIEAYEKVADEVAKLSPDTLIITSPHSVMYADYFHISPGRNAKGSFEMFGAPNVTFSESYDEELVKRICELSDAEELDAGILGEKDRELDHGTMVPLWFIRKKYSKGKIVRIGLSGLPLTEHYRFGQLIAKAVEDTGTSAVFIASGDLSHKLQDYGPYGFAKEGHGMSIDELDEEMLDNLVTWQYNGSRTTIDEFRKLSTEEKQEVIDFINDFTVYEEITVSGGYYLLVHAGLGNYSPEKEIEDYDLHELIS